MELSNSMADLPAMFDLRGHPGQLMMNLWVLRYPVFRQTQIVEVGAAITRDQRVNQFLKGTGDENQHQAVDLPQATYPGR